MLARAATKDRTVIMTQINAAWTRPGSLLDLFFESFRTGEGGVARLLDHLVIVTMDPAAYEGCKAVHRHCYFLRTSNGVDYRSEKMFMSKDYLEMMWGRNRFQQTVLELGYNFLFTVRIDRHQWSSNNPKFPRDNGLTTAAIVQDVPCRTWTSCGSATRSGTSARSRT